MSEKMCPKTDIRKQHSEGCVPKGSLLFPLFSSRGYLCHCYFFQHVESIPLVEPILVSSIAQVAPPLPPPL